MIEITVNDNRELISLNYVIGNQGDVGVNEFKIDIPRYYELIDLSTLDIYLCCRFQDGSTDKVLLKNPSIEPTVIIFYPIPVPSTFLSARGHVTIGISAENANGTIFWSSNPNKQFRVNETVITDGQIAQQYPTVIQVIRNAIGNLSTLLTFAKDNLVNAINEVFGLLSTHKSDKNNPHEVTKEQVQLGNVENTSDMDKPLSTAVISALSDKVDKDGDKVLSDENYTLPEKQKLDGLTQYTDAMAGAVVIGKLDVHNTDINAHENIISTAINLSAHNEDPEAHDNLLTVLPPITNLLTNGDFSAGTAGWAASAGTLSVSDNVITETKTTDGTFSAIYRNLDYASNNLYYVRAKVRVTNDTCNSLEIRGKVNQTILSIATPEKDKWYDVSAVFDGTGLTLLGFYHFYSAGENTGKQIQVQYVSMVNITDINSDKAFMDAVFKTMPNNYLDGTQPKMETMPLTKYMLQSKADKSDVYTKSETDTKVISHNTSDISHMDLRTVLPPITNLISNGDFSNGTAGWTDGYGNSTLSVSDNTLTLTGIDPNPDGNPVIAVKGNISFIDHHKGYLKCRVRVRNNGWKNIVISSGDGMTSIGYPTKDQWYDVSAVSATFISFTQISAEHAISGFGNSLEIRYVSNIDLTEEFGAGNEPNKAFMDKAFETFQNKYVDGIQVMPESPWVIKYLLDRTDQLAKAITLLGGSV